MRVFVLGFFAAAFATAAFAQDASPSFGPLRLGASPAEVSASGTVLYLRPTEHGSTSASTRFRAYNLDWEGSAIFNWARGLSSFQLRHTPAEVGAACLEQFQILVSQLEESFGPLDGDRTDHEHLLGDATGFASGGSQIRRYTNRFGHNNVFSTRNETDLSPYRVVAQASYDDAGSGAGHCLFIVHVVSRGAPTPPDPMIAELADVPHIAGEANWLEQPSDDDVRRAYPPRARAREQEGDVVLACRVRDEGGTLRCMIESESLPGWAFGYAALAVATHYRIAPTTNGVPTAGRQLQVQISFRLQ